MKTVSSTQAGNSREFRYAGGKSSKPMDKIVPTTNHPFLAFFIVLVGFVCVLTKFPFLTFSGIVLIFAGLLAPFYKDLLWDFVHSRKFLQKIPSVKLVSNQVQTEQPATHNIIVDLPGRLRLPDITNSDKVPPELTSIHQNYQPAQPANSQNSRIAFSSTTKKAHFRKLSLIGSK